MSERLVVVSSRKSALRFDEGAELVAFTTHRTSPPAKDAQFDPERGNRAVD